jgi:hypothetical protein
MMGTHVTWDNSDQTVIRIDFEGAWTWDDFVGAMAEARQLMLGVSHQVDLIVNMKPGTMPRNGNAFAYGVDVMRKWPASLRTILVVTNPYVQAFGTPFIQLNRSLAAKMHLVTSLEDAYRFLEKQPEIHRG